MKYNQFKVLTYLEKTQENKISQRNISENTDISLGTVNKTIDELKKEKYITDDLSVTEKGLKALEPYRVKRAIFIAAGFGSRMVPITLNTPKPLVRVHGTMIIETLLDACKKAEIEEIIIVRGYLKEQFDALLNKYPNITFIDNPYYTEQNNISSVYLAREYLQRSYVLESDLYLSNPDLIQKYEYCSNYLGKYVERTDDWCFETKNKVIKRIKRGGVDCYHMYGISYYTEEDGKKLSKDMEDFYLNVPGGKDCFFDEVALNHFKDHYNIVVRDCKEGDIVEIDTFNELKEIDSSYDV